ncbi:MAG: hypothetical protein ACKKMS_00230 [Candidatus Nealsonbacteria bacterium]
MPFPTNKIYEDTVELVKELFRGGDASKFASLEEIIKEIFKALKEINEEVK